VSDKTFRKYANTMTIEVFDAMKKELENTYVFISLDSTPGKDRRTFITRRFTFIDAKGTFQSLHFGVLNVDGVFSADQYEAHLLRFFETFQICHLKIENNFEILRQSRTQTVCLGGVADMGPGALQAAQSMMGSLVINGVELSPIGCDVAHGQNNVFKAAVEANELFQDLSEKGQLICNFIRDNYELRKKLTIPIPPKFKVIRWGAVGAVIRYVVKYREQLKDLNDPDINEAIVVFRRPQVILVVRKVMQTLLRSQKYLQMTGPLDVFFMPCQILSVMRELREIKNSVLSYGMPLEFSASFHYVVF